LFGTGSKLISQNCLTSLNKGTNGVDLIGTDLNSCSSYHDSACLLQDVMIDEGYNFEIFEASFYHLSQFFGDFDQVVEELISESKSLSPTSLLVIKYLDDTNGDVRFKANWNANFSNLFCLDSEVVNLWLEDYFNQLGSVPLSELCSVETLFYNDLAEYIFDGFCCSHYHDGNKSLNSCADYALVNDAFLKLSTSPEWLETMLKIKDLIETLNSVCGANGGWGSFKKNGIIPQCFWKVSPGIPHPGSDFAFSAGVTDGAFSSMKELVLLIINAEEIIDALGNEFEQLFYAYTWYYLYCNENGESIDLNQNQLRLTLEKLFTDDWQDDSLKNTFSEVWLFAKEKILLFIKPEKLDCGKEKALRELVTHIFNFITDPTERSIELVKIALKLQDLWYKVDGDEPEERYLQGYYCGKIGLELVAWEKVFVKGAKTAATFRVSQKPLISKELAEEYIKSKLKNELGDSYGFFVKDFGKSYKLVQQIHKDGLVQPWKGAIKTADDIRLNFSDLDIIKIYMARAGKSSHDVVKEIPTSSVLDGKKWLGNRKIEPFLNTNPIIANLANPPPGYQFINQADGSRYIRRINASDPYTPRLMVDETGRIVKYLRPQRLAVNGLLRSRLKAEVGEIPVNHQAHHLVPSGVAQNSVLHQEAKRRGLYDVDRVSNGKLLAETAEDFVPLSKDLPTHLGSHPSYDAAVNGAIDDILDINNVLPSNIRNLTDTQITSMIDDIELEALDILENWIPSKLN